MDHPEPKGRKVVFMLTLKELKKIVKVADMEKRIPSVKSLKEHKVVVKEMINADTTISVYDHGYVLYTAGNQSTVFPLHSCDDYEYVSVTGDNKEFNKEFFDNENWYIRLLMEAEDRMEYSQSKVKSNHGVFSNSDVTDDALMDFIFYSTRLTATTVKMLGNLIEIRSDFSIFTDQFSEIIHVCNNFNLMMDLLFQ